MIYAVTKHGQFLVVLEPGNLDRLRVGGSVKSPDGTIMIVFSPDIMWTAARIREAVEANGTIDAETVDKILVDSQHRPEVKERPYHHLDIISGKLEKDDHQN